MQKSSLSTLVIVLNRSLRTLNHGGNNEFSTWHTQPVKSVGVCTQYLYEMCLNIHVNMELCMHLRYIFTYKYALCVHVCSLITKGHEMKLIHLCCPIGYRGSYGKFIITFKYRNIFIHAFVYGNIVGC